MVAFTYIAKQSGGDWKASRLASEDGPELSAEAENAYELQRELRKLSLDNSDGGSVKTLLSTISKDTLIFQVIVGGAVSAAAPAGGGAAAAASAPAEEKKEEKKEESEEEEDEDMGFSLFD